MPQLTTPRFMFIVHPEPGMWGNLLAISIRDRYLTVFTNLLSNAGRGATLTAETRIITILKQIGAQQPKDIHHQLHDARGLDQKFVHLHCTLPKLDPADLDSVLKKIHAIDKGFLSPTVAKQIASEFAKFSKDLKRLNPNEDYVRSNGETYGAKDLMQFYMQKQVMPKIEAKAQPKKADVSISATKIALPVVNDVKTLPPKTPALLISGSAPELKNSLATMSVQAIIQLGFLAAAKLGVCADPYRGQEIARVEVNNPLARQQAEKDQKTNAALMKLQKMGSSLPQLLRRCFGDKSDANMQNFLIRVLNGDVSRSIGLKFNKHIANPNHHLRHRQFMTLMARDEREQELGAVSNLAPRL